MKTVRIGEVIHHLNTCARWGTATASRDFRDGWQRATESIAEHFPEDTPPPLRVIYTAGVWDLLHRGHLNLLWASKRLGDVLIVGVVSDAGCFAYKGCYPNENAYVRARNLRRIGFVDVVVDQETTDPSENIERFRPNAMTHGDDWQRLLQGNETLELFGVELVLLPYTRGISSSALRERQSGATASAVRTLIERGEAVT